MLILPQRVRPSVLRTRLSTQQSWTLLRYRAVPLQRRNHLATAAAAEVITDNSKFRNLKVDCKPRLNEINIQQLSDHIHNQIFPGGCKEAPRDLVELAKKHLKEHRLGDKTEETPPIGFDLPALQGKTQTLDEHFHLLGTKASEPYLSKAKLFAEVDCPEIPKEWVKRSGWTKYVAGKDPEEIDCPDADAFVFDVEVLWKISPFPVVACAVSKSAWYAWISPWIMQQSDDRQLIPLGPPDQDRVIIGHNVGYDRARIKEEYNRVQTNNCFIDTMSLHVAVNGMCSRQRPVWLKHRKNRELREKIANETDSEELAKLLEHAPDEIEQELWVGRSSVNSLRDVAQFHCNVSIDKAMRDDLGEMEVETLATRLSDTLNYCAADVAITHKVYQKVLPAFLKVCPHPVSFAALRHLSSLILPVNETWEEYIQKAEGKYIELLDSVQTHLKKLADDAVKLKGEPKKYEKDPWMRQLDWSGQEVRVTKSGHPVKRQKMPGMPRWYKDLFPKVDGEMKITVRTRIAPLLLRLTWKGYPLTWTDKYGWTFRVPVADVEKLQNENLVQCTELLEEKPYISEDYGHLYYKVPHKDGSEARCATPLAKTYQRYFEDGTLDSEFPAAKEALEMNAACSYWISARERIMSQTVVWQEDIDLGFNTDNVSKEVTRANEEIADRDTAKRRRLGIILPQLIPMGTITRRAVESTWLTASNAKKKRVGSELKSMIRAPPGYAFVGADVDSEELWIASLVGDAQFKLHGGNAIGFMTLEGTKKDGTDMHSRTASMLGISRNDAKIFNYGRIYGAGLKFATSLLRQFNPSMEESKAGETASRLYQETKGTSTSKRPYSNNRKFWRGGTESFVFNKLEEFAEQDTPRTPVLGAGITEALQRRYINKGSFLTSRINWAIQSSGVDYLHLLIISMDYLIKCYKIDARLMITVHDEIRYLVKDKDRYRAAMALQVSNLWTRAMFAQQMGINDLPQSVAFFSAVDIDHVLRKEVDLDCITPSNPHPIPHGESIDIVNLLEKGDEAALDPEIYHKNAPDLSDIKYERRPTVMSELDNKSNHYFLRAQMERSEKELLKIGKEYRAFQSKSMPKPSPAKLIDNAITPPLMPTLPTYKRDSIELTQLTRISPRPKGKLPPKSIPPQRLSPQSRPTV